MSETDRTQRMPARTAFGFSKLSETGVLWLINRVVFHPRGYALALEYADGIPEPFGWSIQGDGQEVWHFTDAVPEDELLAAVTALLEQSSQFGAAPHPDSDAPTGGTE